MPLTNKTQKHEVRQSRFIARVAKEASSNARKNALSHGRSVTIQQGEDIVKVHPDGRMDLIRKIEKSSVIPEKRLYHL
ncbi:hypothetical protein [Methanosarcina lacustris]|uniref:hypothetical protein n=1 Tax=Methanosarcina lacustris TaxID=170861 RepID=UPI00064EBE47|nr:hypothetical protein [Methanosarcina lacustris]